MKLIYSPDDHGYYWQLQGPTDWRSSQLFKTREAAIRAQKRNTLRWH